MAFTTPRTWVSGELVTAALMNTYIKDNQTAMYAGAMSIASQTGGDFIKAASGTALTRVSSSGVFDAISPLTTRGDVLYASSGTVTGTRLAVGGADTHLGSDGTDVSWEADPTFAGLSPLTTRGDILYAPVGTVTGTRLAVGGAGTHLGSDGTDVAWEADPTFAGLSPLTTRGDLLVGTSGAVTGARLGKGSSGQVLSMADANDIGWAAAPSGKIIQVVGTTYTTFTSRDVASYGATGLSQTITLSDDSNKCIVLCQMGGVGKDASNTKCQLKLLRAIDGGAETMIGYEPNAGYNASTSAINVGSGAVWTILDSPATGSEIEYHVEFASQSGAAVVYVQLNSATSSMTLIEVDA